MPDQFMHIIDKGLPSFLGVERAEDQLLVMRDYLIMLLEELRFLLRHLGGNNFTAAGAREVVEKGMGQGWNTQEDFTAWYLRTDYQKALNYLAGDRSDVNYIRVRGDAAELVTAEIVTPPVSEPLNRDGRAYYWTDAEKTRMTCLEATAWPVLVYRYEETARLSIRFMEYDTREGEPAFGPVIVLGAGDGDGNDRGYLFREDGAMILRFVTAAGETSDISLTDFVDAKHRRLASCEIDTTAGTVAYTVEGDEKVYELRFTVDGDTVTYTWPDGHTCEVSIT